MNSLPSLAVVRRSTVISALALFIYAFARNPAEAHVNLSIIGLALEVPRWIFDWALPFLCFMSAGRYLFYSFMNPLFPLEIKRQLLKGVIPQALWENEDTLPILVLRQRIQSFFPRLPLDDVLLRLPSKFLSSESPGILPHDTKDVGTFFMINYKRKRLRAYWHLSDFEYCSPVILGLFALLAFFISALYH